MARTNLRILVYAVLLVALGSSVAIGAPSREEYELQERCGKRADELFKRDWGKQGLHTVNGSQKTAHYRNYYNAVLNGCFVLYTVRTIGSIGGTSRSSAQLTLFEANTSRDYGFFFSFEDEPRLMDCWVAEKRCTSRQEWDSLAARYLGDLK